jgi:hypothetical protein
MYGTNTAWLEFHVDIGGIYATVKDGEGELLVCLIKLVSGMVRRKSKRTIG